MNNPKENRFLILTVSSDEPMEELHLPDNHSIRLDLRGEEVDWDEVLTQIFESQKIILW